MDVKIVGLPFVTRVLQRSWQFLSWIMKNIMFVISVLTF